MPDEEIADHLLFEVLLLWPRIVAYVVSFLVLGIYWMGHHTQFHFMRGVDRTALWINIFFFMGVCVALFAAAIGVGFVSPTASLAVILLVPVLHILPGPVHMHWTR